MKIENRLESNWKEEFSQEIKPFFLDLLSFRKISNEIAARYDVVHESPQVLIISKGKAVYNESHSGIRLSEILEQSKLNQWKNIFLLSEEKTPLILFPT